MKDFLLNIILFFLLSIALLVLWGKIIDKGLKKSQYFYYAQWNNILEGKVNEDLVIMGSSRAVGHYSPQILDSTLSITSYNLGINGYGFSMQSAKYDVFIEKNTPPKYVLYNVEDLSLRKRMDLFEKEQFLPYLDNSIIREAVSQYKGFKGYDLYNPFTKYLFQKNAWRGLGELLGIHTVFDGYKGYKGQNFSWNFDFEKNKMANPNGIVNVHDSSEMLEFERTVRNMKSQNIKIILVYSPQYIEGQQLTINLKDAISFFQSISTKYDIPYLSYLEDTLCLSKDYFYDSQHLNKKGSEFFSIKLANDLKKYIHN